MKKNKFNYFNNLKVKKNLFKSLKYKNNWKEK